MQSLADRWLPPPASEKRTLLRRWGISVAVALLLHGVIAAIIVLAWRKSPALNPPGPLVVELAPPEDQPNAQPAEPTFATIGADVGRSASAGHTDIDHPFAQLAPKREVTEGTIAPAERADENAPDVRTASGGGEVPAGPSAGLSGPIDTRIAPSFGSRAFDPRAKKAPRKLARSANPLGRQNKQAGGQGPARRLSAQPSSIVINAIGARVQDRVRAAIARANASGSGVRNAVGGAVANNAESVSAPAGGVVTNAIGVAVQAHPNVPGYMGSELKTGPPTSDGRIANTGRAGIGGASIDGVSINNTNTSRPPLRIGALGGPAKNMSGGLNGTDFHPRHP
jgi:hypothetical protein